jgi:GntR family transcriptional regulator, histidine utilization repressor
MNKKAIPAFEQIKSFLTEQISSGAWKPGAAVPSETALMAQFGVSRMTVNRAVRELAAAGLVTRVQGSGTVVAHLHRISSTLAIRDIHEEVQGRGHVHSIKLLVAAEERASVEVAAALGLRKGARVFHAELVHSENGVPIQHEDRYVNPAAAPHFLETDLTQLTPAHHLLANAPLTQASYSIEACLPSVIQAKLLAIAPSEPCLVMLRRTVSGAHVASVARLTYPGSRYSFAGQFSTLGSV